MEPRFVVLDAFHLVGILTIDEVSKIIPKISSQWDEYMKYDELLKPFSTDKAYYGAWINEPDGKAAYLTGMRVEGMAEIPAGLAERTLPAAKYAVFDCTLGTIAKTYDWVYGSWLPSSPYEYAYGSADFEYYPPDSLNSESPTAVYIPVKVKQSEKA